MKPKQQKKTFSLGESDEDDDELQTKRTWELIIWVHETFETFLFYLAQFVLTRKLTTETCKAIT